MSSPEIIFIVGPTAVGKSEVALWLAEHLNGEIVSCDAMQVYKEIRVASNKPGPQELMRVEHHLLDVVSVTEKFDVAVYNRLAREAIEDILRRGKMPLVVGGSGMYMQVLLDGVFEGVGADETVRRRLMEELEEEGKDALYARLEKMDPLAAEKIHPNNTKRLIRALEVCSVQEDSFTALKKKRQGLWGERDVRLFCLYQERDRLYRLIDERVEEMFANGLLEEVRALEGVLPSATARALIGIKEVYPYLEGAYDLERAKYLMKRNTRHLAKRQFTWFRKDPRLQWILRHEKDSPEDVGAYILEQFND